MLYLESLRLRTRDFPAIKFFKETLEDKIGFPTEDGAGSFTLIKHTAILLIAVLYFLVFADGQAWTWPEALETAVSSWLTMIVRSASGPHQAGMVIAWSPPAPRPRADAANALANVPFFFVSSSRSRIAWWRAVFDMNKNAM